MRLPFEFAEPVVPAGVIPSEPGASARRSTHARRSAAERP